MRRFDPSFKELKKQVRSLATLNRQSASLLADTDVLIRSFTMYPDRRTMCGALVLKCAAEQVRRMPALDHMIATDLISLGARNLLEIEELIRFVMTSEDNAAAFMEEAYADQHELNQKILRAGGDVQDIADDEVPRLRSHQAMPPKRRKPTRTVVEEFQFKYLSKWIHPTAHMIMQPNDTAWHLINRVIWNVSVRRSQG